MPPVDVAILGATGMVGQRFVALHGATTCRDLLNVDLNTEEGRAAHAQNNLRETICVPCVRDAAQIVDDLLTPTA